MKVNIASALNAPLTSFTTDIEIDAKALPQLGEWDIRTPLQLKLTYLYDEELLHASGVIEADVLLNCVRCTEDVLYPFRETFQAVFAKEMDEEEEYYLYTGEEITLDQLIIDEVSLNMPEYVLCKEDCRGLCPVCGVNRNIELCGCEETQGKENPFSKLKDLFE